MKEKAEWPETAEWAEWAETELSVGEPGRATDGGLNSVCSGGLESFPVSVAHDERRGAGGSALRPGAPRSVSTCGAAPGGGRESGATSASSPSKERRGLRAFSERRGLRCGSAAAAAAAAARLTGSWRGAGPGAAAAGSAEST
eukprot:scaffold17295_cov120-Isochrysis_galbana.AAC.5